MINRGSASAADVIFAGVVLVLTVVIAVLAWLLFGD
jgi:hypothetical protein